MNFGDYLQKQFSPVSDHVKWSISMIKQWNIKNSSILVDKIVKADPFIGVNGLVDYPNFFVSGRKSNLLLELADVRENVHISFFDVFLFLQILILALFHELIVVLLETHSHQVAVHLEFTL
jgi:hypothetical protein